MSIVEFLIINVISSSLYKTFALFIEPNKWNYKNTLKIYKKWLRSHVQVQIVHYVFSIDG